MTSQTTRPRALTIVGPGKAGRSLHGAAERAGIEVNLLDRAALASLDRPSLRGRIILLAVPDGEISAVCATVCATVPEEAAVGHISGATPLSALSAAESSGIPTFSMHPLQTFADASTAPQGAYCAVTANDPETAEEISGLASLLGMHPFPLADRDRAIYHAAASIASNFLVTLEQTAADLLTNVGIADGRELLEPLISQTVANWADRGAAALTGPIARGDEATVNRHLGALDRAAPEIRDLYLVLAERTRQMANESHDSKREPTAV